jgi:hypothetical protein
VLALRHFEELSNDEVAEVLGASKDGASKRHVRAPKRLKEVFTDLGGALPGCPVRQAFQPDGRNRSVRLESLTCSTPSSHDRRAP